ncbi:hypothetical protein CCAX7_61660 [Capsulimonas corticalis]|uniref:Uncharacterized protein n=1 Tax=Capsulimonas corticalis TaxID=2219043 RepID=A0A402CWD2_9BACT|nr:hypothetical protein CCAX7_61660 [Capsulimonas corticalis]
MTLATADLESPSVPEIVVSPLTTAPSEDGEAMLPAGFPVIMIARLQLKVAPAWSVTVRVTVCVPAA